MGIGKPIKGRKDALQSCKQNEKILIELDEFEPSNIIVNHQNFQVTARINSKLVPVANVTIDLSVQWLDNNIVNEEVNAAMNSVMSDSE